MRHLAGEGKALHLQGSEVRLGVRDVEAMDSSLLRPLEARAFGPINPGPPHRGLLTRPKSAASTRTGSLRRRWEMDVSIARNEDILHHSPPDAEEAPSEVLLELVEELAEVAEESAFPEPALALSHATVVWTGRARSNNDAPGAVRVEANDVLRQPLGPFW